MSSPNPVPADRKIRIGLIGCGEQHDRPRWPICSKNPSVEIVGLVEPSADSLARIPRAPTPARRDLRPSPPTTRCSARSGPTRSRSALPTPSTSSRSWPRSSRAATSSSRSRWSRPSPTRGEVIRLAEAAGRIVLVSYQRHYQPAFRLMKQTIDSGMIGEVQFVNALQNQKWYVNQKAAQRWRIRKELSGGGQLNDSGSHLIDILLYATGLAPETVYCQQEFFDLEVDVNSGMSIRFTNGAIGSLAIVGNAPGSRRVGLGGHHHLRLAGRDLLPSDGELRPSAGNRGPTPVEGGARGGRRDAGRLGARRQLHRRDPGRRRPSRRRRSAGSGSPSYPRPPGARPRRAR